eukprot:scaffold14000_cov135-Isochrysis_galbana.AAC.9
MGVDSTIAQVLTEVASTGNAPRLYLVFKVSCCPMAAPNATSVATLPPPPPPPHILGSLTSQLCPGCDWLIPCSETGGPTICWRTTGDASRQSKLATVSSSSAQPVPTAWAAPPTLATPTPPPAMARPPPLLLSRHCTAMSLCSRKQRCTSRCGSVANSRNWWPMTCASCLRTVGLTSAQQVRRPSRKRRTTISTCRTTGSFSDWLHLNWACLQFCQGGRLADPCHALSAALCSSPWRRSSSGALASAASAIPPGARVPSRVPTRTAAAPRTSATRSPCNKHSATSSSNASAHTASAAS